ncbi:MAG: glutathione S-transferase N-terminal domain-containing protein [Acidiferrobacteraceae bacterium]
MTELYFFWSAPESARVRLALSCKQIPYTAHALRQDDDETFFSLGVARAPFVLKTGDGALFTDSITVLERVDRLFPGVALRDGVIAPDVWEGLLDWRRRANAILERLYAAVVPGYADIGADPLTLAAYKREVKRRFGIIFEDLVNDRYAGFMQLERLGSLQALARHVSEHRFYAGQLSIADVLLAADLFPLQLLDGVGLPVDLMYYIERVGQACGCNLGEGLMTEPAGS